ncbi:MAG: winged helix-turn-helix domain-containing protein [Candidatus Rokubacteria bacterium]|nr:winged helix-turn-helix domain-containing protein [Candidatus Rokubacteria bacterium]
MLARRLRRFAGLIEDLALRDVTARVARLLLDEGRRGERAEIDLPGTRDDVAVRIGTVRELVSRSLARLRAAGAIDLVGRRVRVRDRARLGAIADSGR